MVRALVLCMLATACVRSNSATCDDGTVCPSGKICFVSGTATTCVDPDETCDVEGAACGTGGTCHDGLCVPSVCGNGVLDFGEVCDEGDVDSGDGCAANCASDETCGNGVVDMREACDDRNALSHDGCSSACAVEQPQWTPTEGQPITRTSYAMVFDTVRRRFVVFGGREATATIGVVLGDTAEWEPRSGKWSKPASPIAPPQRADHAMAFDANRGVSVLFGGTNGSPLGDTWEYDGTRWIQHTPLMAPPPRFAHAMVYDARRQRVVVFGGSNGTDPLGDTWEWDGVAWTVRDTLATPTARSQHAMTYDPHHGRTVMYGGLTETGALADTWVLDDLGWRDLQIVSAAEGRHRHALTYVPATDNTNAGVLIVGGIGKDNVAASDCWQLTSDNVWQSRGHVQENIPPATPDGLEQRVVAPMTDHAIAVDPFTPQVILMSTFGAHTGLPPKRLNHLLRYQPVGIQEDPWNEAFAIAERPARYNAATAFDPLAQIAVMFGGALKQNGTGFVAETLIWRGEWQKPASPDLGPGVIEPPARGDASMAFDGKRIVLFGGRTAIALADTWLYEVAPGSDGRWAERDGTAPPARHDAMFTYAGGTTAVLFGGKGAQPFRDTWTWNGDTRTWSELAVAPGPEARTEAGFAVDPEKRRAVVFGGLSATQTTLGDTWILDLQTPAWTRVEMPIAPLPRYGTRIVWSSSRRALILFGGRHGSEVDGTAANDTWEGTWNAADQFEWKQLAVAAPTPRSHHVMFTGVDGSTFVVQGQYEEGGDRATQTFRTDAWRLRYDSDTRDDQCTGIDSDADGLVGCDDPDCWSRCAPLCVPAAVSCPDLARCGDGVCNPVLEGCALCPTDCTNCSSTQCGDFECTSEETTCPGDCPP